MLPKRLIYIFLIVAFLTLSLLAALLYFKNKNQNTQEFARKLESETVRDSIYSVYSVDSSTGVDINDERMALSFVSSGKISRKDLKNGEKYVEIYYVEGEIKKGEEIEKIKVVVQAILNESDSNVYSHVLKDIAEAKRLGISIDNQAVSIETLQNIFKSSTQWNASFYAKEINLESPFFDTNNDYVKLIINAEKAGDIDYMKLQRFVDPNIQSSYDGYIFPDSISPYVSLE